MVPSLQWLVRWGCLALVAVGTLMHMVGMGAPHWVRDQARPAGYPAFIKLLRQEGVEPGLNSSRPGATTRAEARVGLWRWCIGVETLGVYYSVCETPDLGDFPGWWRACQALSIVGTLMGVLACICAGMEIYYTRRGVRFSGLAVLCAISCFVAAVGMGLSHGMFATKYTEKLPGVLHLPSLAEGNVHFMYPPALDWAFGLGAAGATLVGSTGIILVAFITRTYPTYQRAETVVV